MARAASCVPHGRHAHVQRLCGKFGLPPHGVSPFHVGAADQTFDAFVFDAEMQTFTMAKVQGARPDNSTMPTAFTLKGTKH